MRNASENTSDTNTNVTRKFHVTTITAARAKWFFFSPIRPTDLLSPSFSNMRFYVLSKF